MNFAVSSGRFGCSYTVKKVLLKLSEGYDEFAVSLDDLDVHIGEKGSSEIVRGIAARFKDLGVEISGFDMYTTSNVLAGSGILLLLHLKH